MPAKTGDTVKVNYTGKLMDGSVFDSSEGREPMEFTIGQGNLISEFEESVIGLNPGDTITVQIAAEKAYGTHDDKKIFTVPRSELPKGLYPEIGQRFHVEGDGGREMVVVVISVEETTITFDGNHPLAGKDLTFEIDLVEIAG